MQLELRVLAAPPAEPVISVDGAFGCRGLELSHWPGHRTPADLAHELSTGCALAFARLDARERERRADGARLAVNNHYDTDGACALYAVLQPEAALAHERALLELAAAGDFFQAPSELAVAIDAAIGNLADSRRSALARGLGARSDHERHEHCYRCVHANLARWLAGDLASARGLYELELDAFRADRARVAAARRTEFDAAALACIELDEPLLAGSDPGRHALFGATSLDRVLLSFPRGGAHCHRLLVSTRSWFDLPGVARRPRPDLAALARALDALDPRAGRDGAHWHAQPADSPSPELWFGRAELEFFRERNDALEPSGLAPARVREVLLRAGATAAPPGG
ncbi:MAG: hypothetical protein EPO68_04615 [Planctomycetota bacterium]|nr:MAG: hypothetical protein EPO68_04615 [Planctomycetota bacterium]